MADPKDIDFGELLLEWHFPEYPRHERGRWWYVAFFGIALLLIIQAIWMKSYLFIAIIILGVIILLTRLRRDPLDMHILFWEDGMQLNHKFYRWDDFRDFWILYHPPEVKRLYLNFRGARPAMDISLEKQNPVEVRQVLSEFIPEDLERKDEPLTDQWSRKLKI